ncbi:MAG: TonB-dependent receptor, partial [Bacteroidota bacterium]|nr:TonB-dependent receptor [Bacteroidota bacterium]
DFSVLFQGVKNVNNFYSSRNTFAQRNYVSRHLESWTAERAANGDPISYPRLTTQQSPNEINNTFFNVDASYVRLKNVEFGYTVPQRLSKKVGSNHIRMYASGINLLTWDKLPTKDFDPEISDYIAQGFSFPVTRLYNLGINVTF